MALDPEVVNELMGRLGPNTSLSAKETVAPSPEMIEMLRSRQKEQDRNMLLAGASGALGEFLFGGAGQIAGAGAEMAGQFMKRKHSLEDQETKGLMAQMKASKSGLGGKYSIQRVIHPETGKATFARIGYDKGAPIEYLNVVPHLKEIVTKTSEGRTEVFTPGDIGKGGKVIAQDIETTKEGISPAFKTHMDVRVVPQFEATIKADRAKMVGLDDSYATMKLGGVLPSMIALKSLAKELEGGKLTDKDFDIVMKPLSLKMTTSEWAETQKTGKVPERLRDEYEMAIGKLMVKINERMKEYADKRIEAQARTPQEREALRKRLYSVLPSAPSISERKATPNKSDLLKRREELLKKRGK